MKWLNLLVIFVSQLFISHRKREMAGYTLRGFFCPALLLICFILSVSSDHYHISIDTMNNTRHSNRYLGEYKEYFWKDANGASVVSVDFEVIEIVRKASGLITVDIGTTEKSRVNMVRLNLDLCKFIAGDYTTNIVKRFYDEATRIQGLPKKCPVKPMKYSFTNFTVLPKLFPPVVRQLSWVLDFVFNVDGIRVNTIMLTGKVKKIRS